MAKLLSLLCLLLSSVVFAEGQNTAVVPKPKLENDFYDWYERHEEVKALAFKGEVDLVFIGDSITHMFGGLPKSKIARGKKVWQKYYAHRKTLNLGFGWDRTPNVLWRLQNGEFDKIQPKVAVLLIGTNNLAGTKNYKKNSPQEIVAGIYAVCKAIHQKNPQTHVLLLSLLPRGKTELMDDIRKINQSLPQLAKGDLISFVNLYAHFVDESGVLRKDLMHDEVHPNAKGYKLWAETLEPILSELLKDKMIK